MPRQSITNVGGRLDLRLFGCWDLRVGDHTITLGSREQRLLALLALRGRRPRSYVAGTLWPTSTETRAQNSLRAAVLRSRKAAPGLIDAGRTTVALMPEVRVDVHEMVRVAESGHAMGREPDATMALLAGADLLPGWYDDWVLFERERLQHLRLRALESLAESQLACGNHDLALAASLEAIAIEPLRETAHSIAIRAHLCAGNRSAAVREYREYRARLEDELGITLTLTLEDLARPFLPAQRRPS